MSISEIKGFGRTGGRTEVFRGSAYQVDFVPKIKIEVVVTEKQVHPVLGAIRQKRRREDPAAARCSWRRRGPPHHAGERGETAI